MRIRHWLTELRNGYYRVVRRNRRNLHHRQLRIAAATWVAAISTQVEFLEPRTMLAAPDPLQGSELQPVAPGAISQAEIDAVLGTLTTTGRADVLNYLDAVAVSASGQQGDGNASINTVESGPLINLDDFRADPRFPGIDGSGFAVVVLDTGIDLNHPFFGPDNDSNNISDRIVFSYDFSGTNDSDASDTNGHGSNVTSIATSSDGTYTGMAPGAGIIHLKIFPDGPNPGASDADIEEALQWVVSHAATYNIASVNMSLGYGNVGYHVNDLPYSDEFAALANLDIMVSVAAGNSFYSVGSTQGLNVIAADPSVISVGAVYDSNIGSVSYGDGSTAFTTGPDRITPFSQRDQYLLDIMAPGAPITGANQSGGIVTYHGTSQAAPHIAGIAALAQELAVQTLGRRLTLDEFEKLLRDSATTINDGDNENDNVANTGLNFPRVDVLALGTAILAMKPGTISGTVFNDTNGNGANNSEPGLSGWTVYLDSNNNGALDAGTTTISSTNVPVSVADVDTRRSTDSVSNVPGVITDVNVKLNMTHTWDEDVQVYLISPAGTRIELFTDVGGSADNFSNTILDDEAGTAITAGTAPFGSSYRPEEPLSKLDGQNPNGTWILEFSDDEGGDVGTLTSWSLIISSAEKSQVTPAGGAYSFAGLPQTTYVVRQIPQSGWTQTAPASPGYYSLNVLPGDVLANKDFGNHSSSSSAFELSSLLAANGGTGTAGFALNGGAAGDRSGQSVANAGDVNGDGLDDLLIGALFADPSTGTDAGTSYLVFGTVEGTQASLNLSALNGTTGFVLNGLAAGDYSGKSVSGAGDVNGDGFADLLIGASHADPNGSQSGQSYVVFGGQTNLAALDAAGGEAADGSISQRSMGRPVSCSMVWLLATALAGR